MMMGGMFVMMFWMVLGGLVFLALLVALIVFIVRLTARQRVSVPPQMWDQEMTPRYSRGEAWSPPTGAPLHEGGEQTPTSSPTYEYEQPLVQYPQPQEPPR